MRGFRHPVSLYGGSILNNVQGVLIEHPAFMFNKSTGGVSYWGEAAFVQSHFDDFTARCAAAGLDEMAQDLCMVVMDNDHMTRAEQCYILRRMLEYSTAHFGYELIERIGDPNIRDWLKAEMESFPLDLEEI